MKSQQAKFIRVLLADDHSLLIAGFKVALAKYGIEVIGQADVTDKVIDQYEELKPDVLVLDIKFAEAPIAGLDVASQVLKKFPNAKVIFLSQFDQDNLIKEAYRLGGRAFITKGSDSALLADAIKRVHQGELYFLPRVAEQLARLAIQGDNSPQAQLDLREMEIFKMMAQGLTNAEIAEKFNLSLKSISNISQGIKEKLGIHRQADITLLAVKHGLVDPSQSSL